MKFKIILPTFLCLFMLSAISTTMAESSFPIAGTNPSERPADAPVIEWIQRDQAWFEKALTGVTPPFPRSLYFLDNQGNWHTPFIRPGMTAPYDLRGWHK